MGKALSAITSLHQQLTKSTAKNHLKSPKQRKPISQNQSTGQELAQVKLTAMASSANKENASNRLPLSEVVSDCVKRWFKDTLKEAKSGDFNTQVLLSQMYYSGYGVPRDAQKGRIWMTRASRTRSSVWKVSDKHPGYNASDSDSDEMKGDS